MLRRINHPTACGITQCCGLRKLSMDSSHKRSAQVEVIPEHDPGVLRESLDLDRLLRLLSTKPKAAVVGS